MKYSFLIAVIFLSIIIYANIKEMHGIVGLTKRDGGLGCVCHNPDPNDSVIVWIEGPDTVRINDTIDYKLFMTGGAAVAGGFNIASYFGELDSLDTLTHIISGELTHTMPNPFINDTVFWNFQYIAPDSILIDTIYSVGNSVNWDSIPSELDKWNFGENFLINVVDRPTIYRIEINLLEQFVLEQNFPNPFNPSTKISFQISPTSSGGFVKLKVFSILGNEIATLISEEKKPGNYVIEFNADGLPSGIYFYRLEVDGFEQTKKMVLTK